ncbi:hypothetical protein [Pseudaestuariivita atlantica]|uniref:Uncharacterized protein n=1 Tax=Pseudaestuariivita atlantica TaxID=1317121 RepID=A0A0L1JUW2_9RHOB|nr:hypothetical protein [Pseudaestuariivita atlantica]KNG95564.1 hypothetical protein ATO11_02955 [Pseudaestuariivita atlantica]
MFPRLAALSTALAACLPAALSADGDGTHGTQPYAGFESREIKSLSAADLEELRAGGGWGLALPAELGGLPGPAHLLELQEQLGLTGDQVARITDIRETMLAEAIAAGARFIEAERALSDAFADPGLGPERLRALIAEAGEARAALRYVHLSRHLMTPPLLTDGQIGRYAVLRGYAEDPCASVPEGHDATMWRRHNGCE